MTTAPPPSPHDLPASLRQRLLAVAGELGRIRADMAHLSPSHTADVADAVLEVEYRVSSIHARMDWIRWRRHAGTRPARA